MSVFVPTLETERLLLRPWKQADAEPMVAIGADEELMRHVGGVLSGTMAWRRMAAYAGGWQLQGYGVFALEAKATSQFVGYCGIYDPTGWPEREINWGLVRGAHGQGYITEAARRVRAFAYDDLGFATIASCIFLDNAPSIAVSKRLGATHHRTVSYLNRAMGVFRHITPAECRAERGRA